MKRSRRWPRFGILALWAAVLIAFWLVTRTREGGAGAQLEGWLQAIATHPLGWLWLVGIYLLRPLLLLPMTILTVFTGFLFGLGWGLAYALIATLASASLAYLLARFLRLRGSSQRGTAFLEGLRSRAFETVIIARLVSVPGDLVNYASGALRISFPAFFTATAIGGLPGMGAGVLAGASIEGSFRFGGLRLDPWLFGVSAALLLANLVVAQVLRRYLRRG
ncbi:MAG: VTT domain-containing protein [Truepera sp.]|nr:VTT domain-containing protein [Truepera sp.]